MVSFLFHWVSDIVLCPFCCWLWGGCWSLWSVFRTVDMFCLISPWRVGICALRMICATTRVRPASRLNLWQLSSWASWSIGNLALQTILDAMDARSTMSKDITISDYSVYLLKVNARAIWFMSFTPSLVLWLWRAISGWQLSDESSALSCGGVSHSMFSCLDMWPKLSQVWRETLISPKEGLFFCWNLKTRNVLFLFGSFLFYLLCIVSFCLAKFAAKVRFVKYM